jgi:hypothetical protein
MLVFVLAFAKMATSPGNNKNMNVTFILLLYYSSRLVITGGETQDGGVVTLGVGSKSRRSRV